MSSPLRIESPDAWYHVMNRGRRAEEILIDQNDYKVFAVLLMKPAGTWDIKIAAYCLISDHYHILLQTPEANISRSMRH